MALAQPEPEPELGGPQLVERCRRGEPGAFEAFVSVYAPDVGRWVGALVDDPERVADLVQETFVRAYAALGGYRGGDPGAWLRRIAINAARGHHRASWTRRVTLADEVEPPPAPRADGPEAVCLRHELELRLRAALSHLPRKQAEVIRLRYLAGESFVAMAAALDLPESTIRSRVKAGLERLRAELGDLFEEETP